MTAPVKWAEMCDFQLRLECNANLLSAVYDVMREGPSTAESYLDALYATWLQLNALSAELSAMVKAGASRCSV